MSSSYLWRYNVPNRLYFQQCNFLSEVLCWFQIVFGLCVTKFWSQCMLKVACLKLRNQYKGLTLVAIEGWGNRYSLRIILAIFPSIYSCFIIEIVPKLTWMPLAVGISLFSYEVSCTISCLHTPLKYKVSKTIESGLRSITMMADICIALYRVKSLINTSTIGKLLCWDWHPSVCRACL